MLSSVTNALRVVDLLGERGEMGVSDIARDLGLSTATAHRLVQTLVSSGYVDRDEKSRRYSLGPKLMLLASQLRSKIGLTDVLRPILENLARRTNETVNIAAYHNGEIVYLDKIDSGEVFQVVVQVGARLPAYCTAMGRALLAHRDPREVKRYLTSVKFEALTSETITSPDKIEAELGYVRKNGFAVDYGEVTPDVMCVASAVIVRGRPVVAISATAPRSRFEARQEALVEAVKQAAEQAGAALSE